MSRLIHPSAILNAETLTLGDLIGGSNYAVPDYQRDFSWGKDELEKLWGDISATWERSFVNGKVQANPDGHFLGAIVTHRPVSGEASEVIDGQQRLTCFSIIISVLLEFCEEVQDHSVRTNLTMQLLPLIAIVYGTGRNPRIKLAREQEFYNQSVVQNLTMGARQNYWSGINLDKEPVKQRIRDAIILVHGYIVGFLGQTGLDRDTKVANLADVITELMLLLSLEVIDHRMAYAVFETLNFRGLELSQADLLKNELVRRAEQQGHREGVVTAWSEIVKNLDRTPNFSLVEFLQLHFASKYGPVRASELFDSVVKHLDTTSLQADAYTKDLVEESARLLFLVEGDNSSWSDVTNRALDDIRESFGLKFAYPLLMAASSRYVNAPSDFEKWAVRVKNFCLRHYLIEKNPLSAFERIVTGAARDLRSALVEDSDVLLILKLASPDEVFTDRFGQATVSTNKFGFYIIKSIEDHLSGGAGTTFPQGPAQHLEHIMPKKPGTDWDHVSENANYESYLMRIGNLLGLEQKINSHIKNRSFDYKHSNSSSLDYVHSKMGLPKRTAEYLSEDGKWDFGSIDLRQKALATELANDVWPLT